MFIYEVWNKQPTGYISVSSKSEKSWKDYFFSKPEQVKDWIKKHPEEDLYFCTTTLSKPKRDKETILPSKYLWQDLDTSDPNKFPEELKPTIAWQSSPGRFQALWELEKAYEPNKVESLNKNLAIKVHADRGSWILTKVLRIPGTKNFKYPSQPVVKTLWEDGPIYKYNQLAALVVPTNIPEKTKPEISTEKDELLKLWNRIPVKVRKYLMAKSATIGKRSDILWYIEHELMQAGFSTDEIYQVVKGSIWNKYNGRRDEEERLRTEIDKVFEADVVNPLLSKETAEPATVEDTRGLILENDLDLMSNISHYPGWLIEGFWTRRSHGIIAGEPKSMKSTLSLDLAVSVASGKPFLGYFDVRETGPVLIIQNENAPWIMKDRLGKIRASKGLVGSVIKDKILDQYLIEFPAPLPIYYLNQQGFSLDDELHKELLIQIMEKIKPVLVILDSLYLMFAGDVNTSKDLNPILTWLLSLKTKYPCSLVLIHHWKKGTSGTNIRGGQRILGSTVLHGWVESAWYVDVKGATEADTDEKDDLTAIKSTTANVKLVLEREFRGAGTYPKMDLEINMGEFNSPDYSVRIAKHISSSRGKKLSDEDRGEVEKAIRSYLELRKGKKNISISEIQEGCGISLGRKTIRQFLEKIKGEQK